MLFRDFEVLGRFKLRNAGHEFEHMFSRVDDTVLWGDISVKFLGILIYSDLSCDKFLKIICKKASQKLIALLRMANVLTVKQRILLIKSFSLLK